MNLARSAATPRAATDEDIERHFAIGMQQSAAQFAADRLSQDGSDPSGAAASLEASQKRFKVLLSQLVAPQAPAAGPSSAQDDESAAAGTAGSSGAPSASPDQVQKAYADA
ncbi:hypothetical protein [Lichenibacterium dinghuense]|uniref:hypothetical protein n=1 Tax=Lichenibacterium dinghuense TaxID=2895977 RepID=UPI001F199230|nr:hypothetical protein [Lichenibacterium sp. 6Y81]